MKEERLDSETKLVCVLCGEPWIEFMNRCECGGFCTWGYEKEGDLLSWNKDGTPKPPPDESR